MLFSAIEGHHTPEYINKPNKSPLSCWGNFPVVLWICVFLFILLAFCVFYDTGVNSLDVAISSFIDLERTSLATSLFYSITVLGHPLFILVVLFVVSWFFVKKNMKQIAQRLLWSSILATLISLLVKVLVSRPRPVLAVFSEVGGSFPSFHATIALTVYGLLFYVLASLYRRQRYGLLLLGFLLVLLVSFSRIYLNVHYFSDVVGGLLLGMSAILLVKFLQDHT